MKPIRELGLAYDDITWANLLARQAERNGDKPYLVFEDRRWSYAEIDALSDRIARSMHALGIMQGEPVAILAENVPQTLLANFALGKAGAVACLVNTAARGDLLRYYLEDCGATSIVIGRSCVPKLAPLFRRGTALQRAFVIEDIPGPRDDAAPLPIPCVPFDELMSGPAGRVAVTVRPSDPQTIMYTSGTTGPSKGVVVSHAQAFAFSGGRVEYLGLFPDDVVYTCLPLFHGNALSAAAVPALMADATLVLSRRFSAQRFWAEIRRHGVTQFNLLSSMTNILWGQPPSELDRAHRVRQCTMVPVPVFAGQFESRFGVEIVSSYSLTDFGQGTFLQPGHPPGKRRSAGLPRPGVDLAILDDDDQPLPAGAAGEICLRSDDPALGARHYHGRPEADREARRSGWFHTGDRGYLDADGYLYFVDRKKDAIRRRGENISSWEVEQALMKHPAVVEAAVYPVRSELSEDEVAASVVLRTGQTLDPVELVRFCEANMAYFMIPRYVEFVWELPRTLTEKVQKHALRESAESRLHELWDRERAGIRLER